MNANVGFQGHKDEEIDLGEILHTLWAGKWLVVCCIALSLIVTTGIVLRQVPLYQSNILLQVEGRESSLGGMGGLAQQMLMNRNGGGDTTTQIALIKSRFVLDPVVEKLGLRIKVTPYRHTLKDYFSSKKIATPDVSQLKLSPEWMNKKLTLVLKKPNQVSFYDDHHQLILQGALGTLLTSPNQQNQMKVKAPASWDHNTYHVVYFSNESMVQKLITQIHAEEVGSKMHQNTGILDISYQGDDPQKVVNVLNEVGRVTRQKDAAKKAREAEQTLVFLNQQLPLSKKALEESESALNHYRAKNGKIDIKLQTQFLLNQLAELSKHQSELRVKKLEMLQNYTTDHPTMMALLEQMKALETQEDALLAELKTLPESDQIAVNLMRDVKVKQSLYVVLLKKIQELEVIKAGTVSGVRILSYAKMPDAPLPNKTALYYIASVCLGMMLSVSYMFIRKILSPRVNDPHWLEQHCNLPNLAIIPYCKEQTVSPHLKKYPLIAYEQPRNLAVESIRSLRTSLQVTLACASNNIIAVLGIAPGVGKSFVSVNLAYLIAAGGKRVLMIDGDLRRGTVHKYFGTSAKPGLAEVLTLQESLESAIRQSPQHEHLYYLTRGDYPKDPAELLISDQMKAFTEAVSKQFDVVIFDTAPVLLVTDSVLISHYASTHYLVVAAGAHRPGEVEMAMKRLGSSNIQLQGAIFNFHKEMAKNNYYYYGKSYYYGKYYYQNTYYHDEVSSNNKEKIQ